MEEKRKTQNEKMKEYREKQKEKDPEYTARESRKRQERRQRQDPQFEHEKMLNDFFDFHFEKNKHTFPTPVSQKEWEKLKQVEFNWEKHDKSTIKELTDYHQTQIIELQQNLDHKCAGSIIFYIKTFVHRPKDQRKLTNEEKDWVKSLVLSPKVENPKKYNYYEPKKEYYKEKQKEYYEKRKLSQKTVNLNIRFMKADPNKVLSIDDITINPYVSNFCQKEAHKIELWKNDKNPEYLEKWRKQREDYEKEVSELSIEYKENFLKEK